MVRSLFSSFFLRLTIAMALILVVRRWLIPSGWLLPLLCVVAFASVIAFLLAQSVRSSILPLQTTASTLASGRGSRETSVTPAPPDGKDHALGNEEHTFSDFDALSRALTRASHEVDRALSATASSRDELAAMMDSLQDAVVAVDPAGRIQWTNEHLRRLIPSGASGMVRTGHSLVQTIRDPEVLECVRTALEQRVFTQRRTTLLVPGKIVEVNASPMPSGGAVALLHDITRIEQVERTQRDFVANVSHELRTPLTSITGYVETLLDHEASLSPQARAFLETILKNATRMNRLTEDLLTLARVESSGQELHTVPTPVSLLVRDAVLAVSGLVQDAHSVIEVSTLPDRNVLADHNAVIQILTNLIENAIKYGRDRVTGTSRVVVSAMEVDNPMPAVEFSVRDFGQGISSEHLPRLFERFYRVDKARSLETGGTGLGLAIAKHIVQSLGGQIRAESELNQGSRFLFTLPLVPSTPPRAEHGPPLV